MSEQKEQDLPNSSEILDDVLSLQSKYPDKPPADSIDCKPNNIKDLKPGHGFSNNLRDLMANIKIEITEQPATNKLRFRLLSFLLFLFRRLGMRLLSIFFNFQNYRQEIFKNIFLHHYRYESEGRSAGTLLGRNATNKTKTYPTLKILGFQVGTYNL